MSEKRKVIVPMDAATIEWLAKLSRATGNRPSVLVASMLEAIRIDDEAAHEGVEDWPEMVSLIKH